MKIEGFVTTPEGGSRFTSVEVPLDETYADAFGHVIRLGKTAALEGTLVELPAGMDQGWHGAPRRQLVVVLDGSLEVETTDGDVRRWFQGDVFLADDCEGQGHRTRSLEDRPVTLMFLALPANFDVARWATRDAPPA